MSKQKKNNSAWRRVLKRHWKLFFVVFFLLGGLGNIGRNINTVIFCFFLAIVFLCWWQLKRREEIEAKELAEWTKTYEAEKKKKAAEIIEKGGKLQKITEAEYVAMIENARALCA